MSRLKVLTVVGTRPEIIRLSRVMVLLDEHVNHVIVHTGQNYDYELNEIFFKDLELRKPDYFFNVDTSSLEASVGDIIRKSGEILRKEKPDALWFWAIQIHVLQHIWPNVCIFPFSTWKRVTDVLISMFLKRLTVALLIIFLILTWFIQSTQGDTCCQKDFLTAVFISQALPCSKS